jgi:hypothetical protein
MTDLAALVIPTPPRSSSVHVRDRKWLDPQSPRPYQGSEMMVDLPNHDRSRTDSRSDLPPN